ncbi:MAG: hypothetical protein GXO83_09025 [Chlorobi bacterium]|nr:hypothetical protein [Chlorobiota bacterium]
MKVFFRKCVRLIFVILLSAGDCFAGTPDTLHIRKDEILLFNDSIVSFDRDTIIFRPVGVAVFRTGKKYVASREFYDSLLTRNEKRRWISRLYSLLIVTDRSSPAQEAKVGKSSNSYTPYAGYRIRNIKIFPLDPFGPVARDTLLKDPGGIQHSLNLIHITTRQRIIRQNLLFSEGNEINPALLADNERILRQLPYIRDARIIVIPEPDGTADILVITRDVFSIAASYDYSNPEAGKGSVYDNNFLGLGHQLKLTTLYDFNDETSPWGISGSYRIDHIANTFISGNMGISSAFGQQRAELNFERKFISPFIRNAGGVNTQVAYVHERLPGDSVIRPLRYFYHDLWYGHSFLLNQQKRNRLILAGRYYLNNVMERPDIVPNKYHRLQRYQLVLGSISFSVDHYFKSGLIYNFGITEDIPKGVLFSIIGGYEWNEFSNRPYFGTNLSYGSYSVRNGYFNTGISWGGYIDNHTLSQGIFQVHSSYFTPLVNAGRFYFRQFADLDFTTGIRRFSDETINLNNDLGIRGFRSDSLLGTRRLALQLETVVFSPLYVYGFRFTFFSFADLGAIDTGDVLFTNNKLYSGIGLGVRIRNENLVFKTFQIRLAYYPVLPPEAAYQTVVFSGQKLFEPRNFNSEKPDIVAFH